MSKLVELYTTCVEIEEMLDNGEIKGLESCIQRLSSVKDEFSKMGRMFPFDLVLESLIEMQKDAQDEYETKSQVEEGKEYRELRKRHNIKGKDLAEFIGISQSVICAFEQGKNTYFHNVIKCGLYRYIDKIRTDKTVKALTEMILSRKPKSGDIPLVCTMCDYRGSCDEQLQYTDYQCVKEFIREYDGDHRADLIEIIHAQKPLMMRWQQNVKSQAV